MGGTPGLDRAGYLQISKSVDANLITDTMGATTCPGKAGWFCFQVISTEVQLAGITAPGMTGSSLITSGTTYERGAIFACSKITSIQVSAKSSNTAVIAYQRMVL